jgi:3-phenylpropionate/trans-cinnamate dioxygenase ferredoxin reductase subunit
MGGEQKLSGPDLSSGIDASSLSDGKPTLGHANGEAVMVVRRGSEVFAIGATCTHYSGPLAEGLVVGDSVRCPWHHACFSLRTGEAERAPALNPVPCFDVEQRGDRLFVLGKRAARPKAVVSGPASVVIVGAGAAGNAAAEMLRREGYAGSVTLIGADASVPYDRPNLSKDYLAGNAPEEWIPLRPEAFYEERRIALRRGVRVERIDPGAKTVFLSDGTSVGYGALLLCPGAVANRLTVPGSELDHVFPLRSLDDSRAIIERAQRAKRAVVVGASFIGLEVAASLRTRGLEVHVVAPDARPLERILGPELGDRIRAIHEEHGVVFHLGEGVAQINAAAVTLKSGKELAAQLVVTGIGVRPSVELATAAGLAVEGGIVVDEFLSTSAADVWAAGDVARWPDPHSGQRIRVEHWVVAERQGQIAAKNILGQRVRCDLVPFFWSQHYDVAINYVGHAERWDRIDVSGDLAKHDATVTFVREGKVAAVATLGRDRDSLEAEAALEARG